MIGRINHIAIAVPALQPAIDKWQSHLGAEVTAIKALPEHGVTVAFIDAQTSKIELLEPLGEASPIRQFLTRNPDGGMHHICFDVDDLHASCAQLLQAGGRILGDGDPKIGAPKIGAHGKPVIFIHPKDLTGVLVELQQA